MTKRTLPKRSAPLVMLCCGVFALTACSNPFSSSSSAEAPANTVDEVSADDADHSDSDHSDAGDVIVVSDVDSGESSSSDTDTSSSDATSSDESSADTSNEAPASSSSSIETPIGAAGTVDLVVDGSSVTLAGVNYADGWNETYRSLSNGDVDLDVRSANASIDFDADVQSGTTLEVKADTYWQLSAGSYVETTVAGDVTVVYDGSGVAFGAFDLNDGWEVTGQSVDDDEVIVTISDRSSSDTVRITAEVDDGRGEIDTRTYLALNR